MEAGEILVELPVRDRRRSSIWRGLCSVGVLLLAGALLCVPASSAATPTDTAATYTYLLATYQLEQAIVHNAAASQADVARLAAGLGRECQGVLKGSPNEAEGPAPEQAKTPRAMGEHDRSEKQLQTINSEIFSTIGAAVYEPDSSAVDEYVARISPLRWSDPRITALVQLDTNSLQKTLTPPVANVCTDMKTWADSGYRVLSQSSREFEAAQTARSNKASAGSARTLTALLKPYVHRSGQVLIRRTHALRPGLDRALVAALRPAARLERALGRPHSIAQELASEPVIGRGKTSAGDEFILRRERPGGAFGFSSCRHPIEVDLKDKRLTNGLSQSFGTTVCLSRHFRDALGTGCRGDTESITTAVPASVRAVRLQLSNGRTVTSNVVQIPRRDGGPGGIYVQAINSARLYAVSLTELDASGRVILTVKLRAHRCRREPTVSGPTFVDLATGATPSGEEFTIQGVVFHTGHKHTSFSLSLEAGTRQNTDEITIGNAKPKAFPWQLRMECQPHEYAIIYGILAAPGATVLARTATGLVPLTTVVITPSLHSGGPLVYGVFSTLPSELVVLGSDGSTLYTESLAAKGKEEAEFCEGYEER